MLNVILLIWMRTTLLIMTLSLGLGCQRYEHLKLSVRHVDTHEPVCTDIEVSYPINVVFIRALQYPFNPNLKRHRARTNCDGEAVIRVAKKTQWFLLVDAGEAADAQTRSFNSDLGPGRDFAREIQALGWLRTRRFLGDEDCKYEIKLEPASKR